ncbi:MAG: hypothetical protein RBS08_09575 [Bdellovibrionales bacterium]|jgi:hypothetical protein|nr:hypothetical protein [Bdellovibrionales bacterium]
MALGFNSAANKNREVVASTAAMRAQIISRMNAAEARLSNSFNHAAASKDTLLGGMLIGFLGWMAFGQMLQVAFAGNETMTKLLEGANDPTVCAVLDGASELVDERSSKFRATKSALYPKGRKQGTFKDQKVNRKFNLVAANQNYRFKVDARNEVAYMAEMLEMLDTMEQKGVTEMSIDPARPLYDTLKENSKKARMDKVMTRFSMPVRKFA